MAASVQSIVENVSELASPPGVWIKINEVMRNPNSSSSDIAEVVQNDPGLTSGILRLVNSSYYNFPSRIDTVSRAVAIIGMNDLFSLITAITAVKVFSRIPCRLTRPETFWKHSIATGILARKLAQKCSILHTERLYVAGLLHDIGSLVLYNEFPDNVSELLMISSGDEEVLYQAEQEMFGFNHAVIGAELLKHWNLPKALANTVRNHHTPENAEEDQLDASIIHIASITASHQSGCSLIAEGIQPLTRANPAAWEMIGLSEEITDELTKDLEENLKIAQSVMM